MPPPPPTEEALLRAWELHVDGNSDREIAALMAGAPYYCGGHTTARRWRELGRDLYRESTDLGRKAHRYRTSARLYSALVKIKAEMEVGLVKRADGWRLVLQLEREIARLHGTDAAPPARKIKVTGPGGGRPQIDPDTLAALAALDAAELEGDPEP